MYRNVLPLHFAPCQASSSQKSNVDNFQLDCHNPFKIPFKIPRTLLIKKKDSFLKLFTFTVIPILSVSDQTMSQMQNLTRGACTMFTLSLIHFLISFRGQNSSQTASMPQLSYILHKIRYFFLVFILGDTGFLRLQGIKVL